MSDALNTYLGFDPGGEGNFGWSIVVEVDGDLHPCPKTGLANDAWDAVVQVKDAIASLGFSGESCVRATGIDAPLLWNKRGNRAADGLLRNALKDTGFPSRRVGGTVQAVNALRGACVVQGSLLVRHLSETWDQMITESHPKAFDHLLSQVGSPEMVDMTNRLTSGLASHERDATLCAVAAFAALQHSSLPNWQNLYEESCLIQQYDIPVSYWMPMP